MKTQESKLSNNHLEKDQSVVITGGFAPNDDVPEPDMELEIKLKFQPRYF